MVTYLYPPVLRQALQPLLSSDIVDALGFYEDALSNCESYLEQLMLIGLLTVARAGDKPLVVFDRNQDILNEDEVLSRAIDAMDEDAKAPEDLYVLAIQPEVEVAHGDVDRADFTLGRWSAADSEDPVRRLVTQMVTSSGRVIAIPGTRATIAIECDGGGHDRQADAKRDEVWRS